jgi:replicative DNA helicase
VGGAVYLHTLVAGVPIAANAGYYAGIVREKAILRRLVDAGTKIAQLGFAGEGQVDDVVDRAQAEVYSVTDKRTSEDYAPLRDVLGPTLDEIEAIGARDGQLVGVPTGFADLDELTNGLHPGQMIIVAARPAMGKSTMALDICRSAAIRHGLTSAIFSLEMNRTEISMKLLAAEAKIPLHHMRNGHMSDDNWQRLASTMAAVSEAPLFIDDSPNMTMMEIRAKARRLKQRHDLRLIVVDYLQLMTSGKRVESRQLGVLSPDEAAGQGARRACHRGQPAQPWCGAADGQAAPAERPARERELGARRRHGDLAAPRRPVRTRVDAPW